jgi:DNA replication protein DnaC
MLSQLRAARADQTLEKRMLRFTTPDVLIVDDLGLRPLEGDEPIDLYEIVRARYERGSIILTSNRALEEWYPLFRDDLMASAAMDRLLHHAHVLVLEGHSFRNPPGNRKAS